MSVFINPGSGPVASATEANAIENMRQFCKDVPVERLGFARCESSVDYGDGRFAFLLWKEGGTRCHEIQMPGIPLDRVRWMDYEDQNIWDFPRLYADGDSWVWKFAMNYTEEDFAEPGDPS